MMYNSDVSSLHNKEQSMQRTQISLEPEQRQALTEIARRERRSLSEVIRQMIDEQIQARQQRQLEQAAQALLTDYQANPELSAFSALDGQDFHAQG
jgi:metal-responsive CopG/Arc/MetJ family transcriptional regulator